MSLFHKFRNVYYDAVQLATALERIPDECLCGNAESHLAGQCNCATGEPRAPSEMREQGWFHYLRKLESSVEWLKEDLDQVNINQARQKEQLPENIFMLMDCVHYLTAVMDRLEQAIEDFRLSGTDKDLLRLKECGQELRKLAEQLNAIL